MSVRDGAAPAVRSPRPDQVSLQGIRAVCFDLDDTFWDVWPVIRRAEQAMYDYLAKHYPRVVAELTLESMRAARERVAQDFPEMQHDFTFLRKQALLEHARAFGYGETMAEEAFDVFIQARNQVVLYEDVLSALDRLAGRYRLFTASNGNADLRKIGIAPYFERCVAAREVGALKPDAAVFHTVIEGTGLAAHEVLHVGDDPLLDVEGARRAGMAAVWLNRTAATWPADLPAPLHTVTTLTELVELLEAGGV
ncbi:MAG: hypothetical protein DIU71_05165 [Proteobacteria bacterium]|nr:MAG: hypothetical protein DIU71_05165 [Pseudomonadota bacterium]